MTTVGLAYHGQFKLSADEHGRLTPALAGRKDRVLALGAAATVVVPKSGAGFAVRVEPELAARNRTQGWTVLLTVGKQLRSFAR